jgi:hypothetical protein
VDGFLQRYVGYCCTGLTSEHGFQYLLTSALRVPDRSAVIRSTTGHRFSRQHRANIGGSDFTVNVGSSRTQCRVVRLAVTA